MKAVLYVKKEKPYVFNQNVYEFYDSKYITSNHKQHKDYDYILNGKIIAECNFEIEDIVYKHIHERDQFGILHNGAWYEYKELNVSNYECDLASRSGFKDDSSLFDYLFDYLDSKNGKAIHIKNLHIFDNPRELSDYEYTRRVKGEPTLRAVLFEAPKNMKKIIANGTDAILISITPQEARNILNGKQDVLIRRNVLKEIQ